MTSNKGCRRALAVLSCPSSACRGRRDGTNLSDPSPASLPWQARREATLPKVRLIRALQDDAMRRRAERRYDAESLAVAARLLEINPEVSTAWNFRREAIVALTERARRRASEANDEAEEAGTGGAGTEDGRTVVGAEATVEGAAERGATSEQPSRQSEPPAAAQSSPVPGPPPLRDELALTERTLRKNPKSYCSWFHRRWTVRRLVEEVSLKDAKGDGPDGLGEDADAILGHEMKLIAKLLELDDRNFHCWGYRRFVTALRGAPDVDELEYTTHKIEANFSNYSAWHHRSTYLPLVSGESTSDAPPSSSAAELSRAGSKVSIKLPKGVLDAEYELVQQAFFTEPEDQSGWMYHRWLLGNTLASTHRSVGTAPAEDVVETLEREADLCRQLVEMEPGSKWPVLTLATLCKEVGSEEADQESAESFRRLVTLDPMRRGYYCDCCRL